jgi:hypothetical protein
MVKKCIFIFACLFCYQLGISQKKRVAVIGLSTCKTKVGFFTANPPNASYNIDLCTVANGTGFNDEETLAMLRSKVDSILIAMDFDIIPYDSVLNSAVYTNMSNETFKYTSSSSSKTDIPYKGFAYPLRYSFGKIHEVKSYFDMESKPDVVVDAYAQCEVKVSSDPRTSADITTIDCFIALRGYSPKGKKVFNIFGTYRLPNVIKVKYYSNSCWGRVFLEDIGTYQILARTGAFKLFDFQIPKEIEDVKKYFEKEKK